MEQLGVAQAWLVVGLPALLLAIALFLRRTPVTGLLAFVSLAAGFGLMAMADRASAAVFGLLMALLYAAGRGGETERAAAEPNWRKAD